MAKIISLQEYRARKNPLAAAFGRLDLAVGRLDPLVRGREGHLSAAAERELAQIARAVSDGLTDQRPSAPSGWPTCWSPAANA